mmetsp:Transcript_4982/g.14826  ORF Transcript_4982/g.14826 Transcript_4982/m.14826 type:complete len:213 (-) Transcript_4982:309-947(-)
MQPLRMHFFKSSTLGSSPSKYIIMISSSCSTAVSMSWDLISSHFSFKSSGISWYSNEAPSSSPFHTMALFSTKSTTPANSSSAPIGTWITSGLAPKFLTIMSTVLKKLAPILSILLTKQILGTPYLSACLQTVSDCGSTPATESKRQMAPSKTFKARSTSKVKSTCPGVSIILMRASFHAHVVAAEVIVIPLSCSCSIQSMVAAPSWTSPIL